MFEGLQISLDSMEEERRLLQEKLQSEQDSSHTTVRRLETELEKVGCLKRASKTSFKPVVMYRVVYSTT